MLAGQKDHYILLTKGKYTRWIGALLVDCDRNWYQVQSLNVNQVWWDWVLSDSQMWWINVWGE